LSFAAGAPCIAGFVQPGTTGVLLERERELETLRGGLDRACAGEGTLLLIEGPAGVGKTALLREARVAADRAGITTLEARSSQLEQPPSVLALHPRPLGQPAAAAIARECLGGEPPRSSAVRAIPRPAVIRFSCGNC
jgi:hypothetical protein